MPNLYITPQKFLEWLPQFHAAELTNDVGGFTASNPVVQEAINEAIDELESGVMTRDDIPIPILNHDGSCPTRVEQFLRRVTLFNLYTRRAIMPTAIRDFYDIEMTWLHDIVMRRKNIRVTNSRGQDISPTTESPTVGWGGIEGDRSANKKRLFDRFTF